MERSVVEPFVLIKRRNGRILGTIIFQVDDSYGLGTTEVLVHEETAISYFRNKPRVSLSPATSRLNGLCIRRTVNVSILTDQRDNIVKLRQPVTQKDFSSVHPLDQYIGANVHHDVCDPVQLLAPGNSPSTSAEFKALKKILAFLRTTIDDPPTCIPLN